VGFVAGAIMQVPLGLEDGRTAGVPEIADARRSW